MAKVKSATRGEYESYQKAQSEAAAQLEQAAEGERVSTEISHSENPQSVVAEKTLEEEEDLSDHEEEEKDEEEEDPQIPEEENSHDGNEETGNEHKNQPEQPTIGQASSSSPYLGDEDESLPLPPEKFYFSPKQYRNSCKIATRCYVMDTVTEIKKYPNELEFFTRHPQLKHIFHIAEEPNRKSQGIWMLLLHHAWTDKENELWFVVNGVPIRYSIKEHALLSGLDCHDYPSNYNDLKDKKKGDYKFVERWFGSRRISIADVKEKLATMKSTVNKKKMALLYVLSNVLKAKSKVEGNIEPFLLKVVDDLKLCETFPWGRYTFDDCIAEVKKIMKKFKRGIVKKGDSWCFSGFILPLEAFPFECIPELGRTFRVSVAAEKDCPRLCKHMFKDTQMKGYPLEDINDAIGRSKDIISILEPTTDEESLMERIIDPGCDDGVGFLDPIVEGWRNHLIVEKKKLWWESLYEADLAGRGITENVYEEEVPREEEDRREDPETSASIIELKEVIKQFTERMDRMEEVGKEIKEMVGGWNERLVDLERFVKEMCGKAAETGASRSLVSPIPATNEDGEPISGEPSVIRRDEMEDVIEEDHQREEGGETALEEMEKDEADEDELEEEEKEEAIETEDVLEEDHHQDDGGALGEEDHQREEGGETALEEMEKDEADEDELEEEEKEKDKADEVESEEEEKEEAVEMEDVLEEDHHQEDEEPPKKRRKSAAVERKERPQRKVLPSAAKCSPYVQDRAKATGKGDGKKKQKGKKQGKGKKKK